MSLCISNFDGMFGECCRAPFVAEAPNADKIVSETGYDVAKVGSI